MATETETKTKPRTRRPPKRKLVEEHARSYFQACANRDAAAMAAHWSPEGVEDVVPVGVLRGPGQIEAFFGELFAALPDSEMAVRRVVADDRHAGVDWRLTGTFSGAPFQGIEPTGRRVELRGFDLLEIEDGKILGNTVYYDGADFARQIGMLPPMDSGTERAMKSAFNAVTKLRKAIGERSA
jgi:steroid delta-isomerase-like uncharacterized protein